MSTSELLDQMEQLLHTTQELVVIEFSQLNNRQLKWKSKPESWSIAECLAHLNSYSQHYNAAFEQAIKKARKAFIEEQTKSTWLGRKCISAVHVENMNKKMKTPKKHNFCNSQLDAQQVLSSYHAHQTHLLTALKLARKIDINRVKVPIELLPILRLPLVEFFQFLIRHQERHLQQAVNVKNELVIQKIT